MNATIDGGALEGYIREVIRDMMKPRLLCICGAFLWRGNSEMEFYKCANCGGWMSALRLVESGTRL